VILGPAFNVPVTDEIVHQFMWDAMAPADAQEHLKNFFFSMQRISHVQFMEYLMFLHLCLNNQETDLQEFYEENDLDARSRNRRQLNCSIQVAENDELHNSYQFEQALYRCIRSGKTEDLNYFLRSNTLQFKEGKLAHTPLRHSKNLFITTVAKVGTLSAIPGGVDIEKTYQIMDFYIQECERLQTIDDVQKLQYVMIFDFCQRVADAQIPKGVSPEVYQCINFIRNHTKDSISVDDVAKQVNRSGSYMARKFKEEVGIQIGSFIMHCKLEDAKNMLTYSDMTLAEISSYLCFSSQSYFQNVFKKQYGVTPLQYRKNTAHEI
jgi:AraC-like DNA-binding protein